MGSTWALSALLFHLNTGASLALYRHHPAHRATRNSGELDSETRGGFSRVASNVLL